MTTTTTKTTTSSFLPLSRSNDAFARVIDPPVPIGLSPAFASSYLPELIHKLSRLAFPDHDDRYHRHHHGAAAHRNIVARSNIGNVRPTGGAIRWSIRAAETARPRRSRPGTWRCIFQTRMSSATGRPTGGGELGRAIRAARGNQATKKLTSRGVALGANLTRHDVYLVDFSPGHHTLSLTLGGNDDGGGKNAPVRVHGHVRRYLPFPDTPTRGRGSTGQRHPSGARRHPEGAWLRGQVLRGPRRVNKKQQAW